MRTKKIGVVSRSKAGGLAFVRAYQAMRYLDRSKYEIIPIEFDDCDHSTLMFLDLLVFIHSWDPEVLTVVDRAKRYYNIPVVFDVDDLLTDLPADHPEFSTIGPVARSVIPAVCRKVDALTVSTKYLQEEFGILNKNTILVQNSYDKTRFEELDGMAKPIKAPDFTVGWTGGPTHMNDLQHMLYADLAKFLREFPDTRAFFHGLCPQPLLDEFGTRVIFQPQFCDYMDFPAVTKTYPIDCMVVPLYPHPFNNAKSDLRLLDMAPIGVPIIASPRADFKEHGKNGYVKTTDESGPDGFYNALKWAYENPKELQEMADRAKVYVREEREVQKTVTIWDQLFRTLSV